MIKLKNLLHENNISENLKYHIRNQISLNESVFRYGSKAHFDLINEARGNFCNVNNLMVM